MPKFRVRLYNIVWDNCPYGAKEMVWDNIEASSASVAGKMALSRAYWLAKPDLGILSADEDIDEMIGDYEGRAAWETYVKNIRAKGYTYHGGEYGITWDALAHGFRKDWQEYATGKLAAEIFVPRLRYPWAAPKV